MNTSLFDNAFPFTGLFRKQAATLETATKQLAAILHDFAPARDKCGRIEDVVSEGVTTCREIERQLSLTFIEPLDREDIRELNRAFERTLEAVAAVASRLGLYEFREIQKGAGDQVACLAEMAQQIAPLLEVIVRHGTGAANFERVRKLKREADTFLLVGMGEMYESAGGGVDHLLEALKWSQIYDRLEEIASGLEHTMNVIGGIIQKKV